MTIKLAEFPLRNLTNPLFKVEAQSGSRMSDCLKECIVLAIANDINVELIFTEKSYIVNPQKILASVTNQNNGEIK